MVIQPNTGTATTPQQTPPAAKYNEQGDTYFDQGLYDEAVKAYDSAIEIDPELSTAYWGRGRVYHFDKGLYSRAINDYSRAIESDPEYTEAYYYRGLAHEANGVHDRAIDDLSKAIKLDPSLTMAYNIRAWCYARKAQWDRSSQLSLYRLIERDRVLAEAYEGLGWIYVKQTQWELFAIPYVIGDSSLRDTGDKYGNTIKTTMPDPEPTKGKFPVIPYVTVTPVSGPVGAKLLIYGWGFRNGEDGMTVTWDGEIIMVNIVAETDGSLMVDGSTKPDGSLRETIYVPESVQGRHIVGVYGSSFTPKGIVNDTIFEVTPEINLTLKPDIKGTKVTVAGTGFTANEIITIGLDDTTTDVTANANNNGSFNAVLVTPTIKSKEYTIAVSGNEGNSSQASFIITLAKPIPDKQDPDIAEFYYNRGYAHFKKAQWALAIADLDNVYAKDPTLNRGSWNRDWALEKQKQWNMVIADYDKAIAIITDSNIVEDKPGSGALDEELSLALADYNKAVEISKAPAFAEKARKSIKFIEEWSKGK
jgi:tetratricopeptide (TPR) repeat protein